jgi:dTDP-4-amino-4,6-dideoxygalactose transaminase
LTNGGPFSQEFEKCISDYLGVSHVIAVCNATCALEISSKALNLIGEVIVPSFTFVATAHALRWQGIRPVFVDIDSATHNIDPRKLEAAITPRTTGIVGVHLWGRACDVDAIETIAQKHGLQVMYDASHGFGNSHKGKMIGNFGRCEVFSFHATKFINCLEGGVIVTNDDELAKKIRLMINFGFTGYDQVDYLGINGKMNEISAAMGITNLEAIDSIIEVNFRNYIHYLKRLSLLPGISVVKYIQTEKNNYQYIVIEVEESVSGTSRDSIVSALHSENIIARKYFWPGCHNMEPYLSESEDNKPYLPETESVASKVVVLPTGQSILPKDVERVCNVIAKSVQH